MFAHARCRAVWGADVRLADVLDSTEAVVVVGRGPAVPRHHVVVPVTAVLMAT